MYSSSKCSALFHSNTDTLLPMLLLDVDMKRLLFFDLGHYQPNIFECNYLLGVDVSPITRLFVFGKCDVFRDWAPNKCALPLLLYSAADSQHPVNICAHLRPYSVNLHNKISRMSQKQHSCAAIICLWIYLFNKTIFTVCTK